MKPHDVHCLNMLAILCPKRQTLFYTILLFYTYNTKVLFYTILETRKLKFDGCREYGQCYQASR